MIEMLEGRGTSALRERLEALAAPGAPLAAERRAAFARFERLGWPTRRLEAWKYTSVAHLAKAALARPRGEPELDAAERRALGPEHGGPRLVLVDGRLAPGLSRGAEALAPRALGAGDAAALDAREETHPFAALNAALFEGGLELALEAARAPEQPLELVLVRRARDAAVFPRVHLRLERGARLRLFVRHVDLGSGASLSAGLLRAEIGQGAELEHCELVPDGGAGSHLGLRRAALGRDARLASGVLLLGAALQRDELEVRFREPGGEAELSGLAVAGRGQHVDCRTSVDHAPPACASRQLYHAVVGPEAHAVFNGAVLVRPHAQGTQARQTNRNLLLADTARADTKPELEIFADDVQCSHGATIGQLDETALFYLRSRALGERQARALLTRAFAAAIPAAVRTPALAAALEHALERRLEASDLEQHASPA